MTGSRTTEDTLIRHKVNRAAAERIAGLTLEDIRQEPVDKLAALAEEPRRVTIRTGDGIEFIVVIRAEIDKDRNEITMLATVDGGGVSAWRPVTLTDIVRM